MYATIRGTRLYFDIGSCGLTADGTRPPLVVLHGGPGGDSRGFKSDQFPFGDLMQMVFLDHRGCGMSQPGDEATYTMENNIEDIEALRQYLGFDRISVLGASYGGMVAQGYATRYPHRVANLILQVTAPSYEFIDEAKVYVETHGTAEQKRFAQLLWDGAFETDAQIRDYYASMGPLYSREFDRDAMLAGWKPGMSNIRALNQGFGGFLRTFDWRPDLCKITCPTLILAGAHDWICSPRQSRIIASHIPHALLKIFPQSSHAIPFDEPDAYQRVIRGFLTHAPR